MPRSRTRSPPSRSYSRSPRRREHRRRRSRSRSPDRRRRYDRDRRSRHDGYDRKRRDRYRSRSRSASPPRQSSRPSSPNIVKENGAPTTIQVQKPSTSFVLPEEIKNEFLAGMGSNDGNIAQNEALMHWLGEKVVEIVEAKIGKIDEVVRERVSQEKLDIEARLRVQIHQEMKEEMDAAQKRQEEAQQRYVALQEELAQQKKDLEEAENRAREERLEMLASRSRLDKERQELEKERKKLVANEQQTILNTGGVRAPIKLKFGSK